MPHNAYEELSEDFKKIFGHETRLESEQVARRSIFHPSVLNSPLQLKDPKYMITIGDLRKKFGPSWQPVLSELNEYELYCKEHWGKSGVSLRSPHHRLAQTHMTLVARGSKRPWGLGTSCGSRI